MKAYLRAFVNYEHDNGPKLLLMAEFAYNNAKYASAGYTSFELNCGYYRYIFYKEDSDPRFRSKTINELTEKLRNLMAAYRENLQHSQELQK